MNRRQRMMAMYRKIAEKAVDAHMEYKLTFIYTASVLALQKAHAKVNWDNYFRYFQEIYQEVLQDPDSKIKEAEQILGGKFEFQMPEGVGGRMTKPRQAAAHERIEQEVITIQRSIDITGQRYGRLIAIQPASKQKGRTRWLCKCDCGNTITVLTSSLRTGNTKSCGCIEKERCYSEGNSKERLYIVWSDMRRRCCNPKDDGYKNYGGRGIKVCDEWLNDYSAFRTWAYNNGYDETLPKGECTIDRVDVNGDYCPDNCRWANKETQANNTRHNRKVTLNGETKSIRQWIRILGIGKSTVYYRIKEMGYTPEQALTTKKRWEKANGKHTA